MRPVATTLCLPRVRNSRGAGTRAKSRRSNRVTVWKGAGSLSLSPGVDSTRTGRPNWETTANSRSPTVTRHSEATPRPRMARSVTPRVKPSATSILLNDRRATRGDDSRSVSVIKYLPRCHGPTTCPDCHRKNALAGSRLPAYCPNAHVAREGGSHEERLGPYRHRRGVLGPAGVGARACAGADATGPVRDPALSEAVRAGRATAAAA